MQISEENGAPELHRLQTGTRTVNMDIKKFFLILAAIAGLTVAAVAFFKCVTMVQTKRYEQGNFEPLCEHRGGSFTIPRHLNHQYQHPNHIYQHRNRYSRPLPVKTYFKPIYPQRRKIRHRRRRARRIC